MAAEYKGEGSRIILTALKDAITNAGLPITEIAERAAITRQYLHLILADKTNPTLETVEKIFQACGDNFGEWFRANAADRYGRDKGIHDQLQILLDARGDYGRTIRFTIASLLTTRAKENTELITERESLHKK